MQSLMELLSTLRYVFFFPGILFILAASLWLAGIDRKLTARMQRRVGPPLLQPWYDYLKCRGKETIIPRKANRTLFLAAPVLGMACVLVCGLLLPVGGFQLYSQTADLVVLLYLLTLASVTLIIGSAASGSPFAGVGLSREMVAMISYELPFVLVLLACGRVVGGSVSQYGVTFSLHHYLVYQGANGPLITHWSLVPAAIAFLFVIPCEVGHHPLDIDEAETEICEGVLAEYSGEPLARFKMMHYVKMYLMSALFVALFLNVQTGSLALDALVHLVLCTLVTFVSMTLPHAVSARFRVEQVFKFYWTVVTALAGLSLVLVWCGL